MQHDASIFRCLSAALAALLLAGCADRLTAPAPVPEVTAPARVLGLVEVTFEAAGTPQMSASAHWLGTAPGGAAGRGGLSFDLTPVDAGGDSGIQLSSSGRGFVDVGSTRYLYASFQVRNAATNGNAYGVARKNVTFVAYTGASTYAQTAVTSLSRFDGSTYADAAARDSIAREILPTHGMTSTGSTPRVVSELADFQALPESDLTALPTGSGSPLAYGYVVRCVSNCADGRTLAASPAPGQYDGRVTFAVKMPLQAAPADDPFRFSMIFLAVEDGTTRVTEGPEEQGTGSVAARAAELPGSIIEILGAGSVAAGGHSVQRLCRVRTAGTDPASPLATLVDAAGCTPGAVSIPTSVRVVDASAAPGGDGESWATAFDKLQDALSCVRDGGSCAGVTEIWVAKGVYYPDEGADSTIVDDDVNATFSLVPGVSLYGGFAGTELSREQRDWSANLTVLSGDLAKDDLNGDGNFVAESTADVQGSTQSLQIVTADGTATPITRGTVVDGFTITAAGTLSTTAAGGGFGCTASGPGAECSPTLSHLVFSANRAVQGGGAALYAAGGVSSPLISDVEFTGNLATAAGGAFAVGVTSGGTVTPDFARVRLVGNTTASNAGGAVYLTGTGGTCSARMVGVRFEQNHTRSQGNGGAVYQRDCLTSYTDVVFWKNGTTVGGGGADGGAVYVTGGAGKATFTNVTFAGNVAPGSGGAVYVDLSQAPTFTNVIVWGNTAPTDPEVHLGATTGGALAHSIIQGGCPANATTCTAVLSSDPELIDLFNGDLRLQSNSPAVDTGDTGALPSDVLDLDRDGNTAETLPLDGSLLPRVVDAVGGGAKVDRGAYERQ
jgi:predicted outer membrane repeat protein